MRKLNDIDGGKAPRTVVLREKVWRIELSRRKVRAYLLRHKKWLAAGIVAALVVIVYSFALTGLASSADFYPSSCLGNWENVENVLGKPDVGAGAPASSFTTLNSATFPTSSAQMFCGNFSGGTPIAALQNDTFEKATLVISWNFAFPSAATGTAPQTASGTATTSAVTATTTASTSSASPMVPAAAGTSSVPLATSSESSIATSSAASTTGAASPTSAVATGAGSATTSASTTANAATTTVPATSTTTAPTTGIEATTSAPSNTTSTNATSTATSTATGSPPPPPPPSPSPPAQASSTDNSSTSTTSFLWPFFSVAHAEGNTGTSTAAVATSSGALDIVTTTVTTTEASTSVVPDTLSIDTSAFQSITVPTSSAGDILSIEISTDGATWVPVARVNENNWQTAQYDLPIHSWDELAHLQVAFVGLPTAGVLPHVYIDAVGVSVTYGAAAPAPNGTDLATSTTSTASTATGTALSASSSLQLAGAATGNGTHETNSVSESVSNPALSKEALNSVFSPSAEQQCAVTPFFADLYPGGETSLLLSLIPSPPTPVGITATSSATSTATSTIAQRQFLFDASLGTLPDGISASITPGGNGTDTIGVGAAPGTARGSYAIVVVYKERQKNGSILPNFCQFDVVIH